MGFLKNQFPNLVNMFHCPHNKNKKLFTCIISGTHLLFKCTTATNGFLLVNAWYSCDCVWADTLHNLIYFSKQPGNLYIRISFYTKEKWHAQGHTARADLGLKAKPVFYFVFHYSDRNQTELKPHYMDGWDTWLFKYTRKVWVIKYAQITYKYTQWVGDFTGCWRSFRVDLL